MSGAKKASKSAEAKQKAKPPDMKRVADLGLPELTQPIQDPSGLTYALAFCCKTPDALAKAILRVAAKLRSPLRDLLDKRTEYDEALERLLYEDETNDCHDTINELRVRLRELSEKTRP